MGLLPAKPRAASKVLKRPAAAAAAETPLGPSPQRAAAVVPAAAEGGASGGTQALPWDRAGSGLRRMVVSGVHGLRGQDAIAARRALLTGAVPDYGLAPRLGLLSGQKTMPPGTILGVLVPLVLVGDKACAVDAGREREPARGS